jgi:hypothetical protein
MSNLLNRSKQYLEDIADLCKYLSDNNITDLYGYAQAIGVDVYDDMTLGECLDEILAIEQYAQFH